jgi:hypothetical protein
VRWKPAPIIIDSPVLTHPFLSASLTPSLMFLARTWIRPGIQHFSCISSTVLSSLSNRPRVIAAHIVLNIFRMLIPLPQACKGCLQSFNDFVDIPSRLVNDGDTHMSTTLLVSNISPLKRDPAYPTRKYLSIRSVVFISIKQEVTRPGGTKHL